MIKISKDFVGGNIFVLGREGSVITLEREARDSDDWFYWAFEAEADADETVTFKFGKFRLGYYGPAVSHDRRNWRWLGAGLPNEFTYNFKAGERVWFCHHMLYDVTRFDELAAKYGAKIDTLCTSRHGRSVPCITIGDGDNDVILTARHHACESTGNYVLEGLLDALLTAPIEGYRFFCVPFVDYDGVIEGDQGKFRHPHDHARDYSGEPIYPEVAAIRKYVESHNVKFGFDFHSPWHIGGQNDKVFIPQKSVVKLPSLVRFGKILEKNVSEGSLKYYEADDFPPNKEWNKVDSTNFAWYMLGRPENDIAFTLETTYFGVLENVFSDAGAVSLGHDFYSAFNEYIKKTD